ncbi:hypothetical protein BOQ07_28835 [Klebsiella michiganensis]|nr:hypothetical protein BOQ07_28835 [Klebsiella michiganensis]
MQRNCCQKGYVEWRKNDGFGCLNWVSAPGKWICGQKNIRNGIFTHRLMHNRVIEGMGRDEIHGQSFSKEAIQIPNHQG